MRSIEETINALKTVNMIMLTYLYSCDKNDVKSIRQIY